MQDNQTNKEWEHKWEEELAAQENQQDWALLIAIAAVLFIALTSCSSTSSICHKPSKREINKAMKHSSWEYSLPEVKSNTGLVYKSNLCFHKD